MELRSVASFKLLSSASSAALLCSGYQFWIPCDVSYTGIFPGISHSFAGHIYGSDEPGQRQDTYFLTIEAFQIVLYVGHV